MEKLPEKWQELLKRSEELRSKEELLVLLYSQLEKDLRGCGLEVPFTPELSAEKWPALLEELLSRTDNQKMRQLIYFVDLPESLTAVILSSDNPFSHLSESILHRELVKIYFRLYY